MLEDLKNKLDARLTITTTAAKEYVEFGNVKWQKNWSGSGTGVVLINKGSGDGVIVKYN